MHTHTVCKLILRVHETDTYDVTMVTCTDIVLVMSSVKKIIVSDTCAVRCSVHCTAVLSTTNASGPKVGSAPGPKGPIEKLKFILFMNYQKQCKCFKLYLVLTTISENNNLSKLEYRYSIFDILEIPKLFSVIFLILNYRNSSEVNFNIISNYQNKELVNFDIIEINIDIQNLNFDIIEINIDSHFNFDSQPSVTFNPFILFTNCKSSIQKLFTK